MWYNPYTISDFVPNPERSVMGQSLKKKKLPKGISQRKNGKYEARFTTKYGKRVGGVFLDLTTAKEWLAKAKLEDEAGKFRTTTVTLKEWYDIWIGMKESTIKDTTMISYKHACSLIPDELMKMDITKIKPYHFQKMFNSLSNVVCKSTVTNYRVIISGMFQQAMDNELIDRNPVRRKVTIPKCVEPATKRQKFLTKEEQASLTDELQKKPHEKTRLFEFVLQTGLRAGEVIGLTWSNVDFVHRLLTVRSQFVRDGRDYIKSDLKTDGSVRVIPLTNEAIRILNEQKSIQRPFVDMQYSDVIFLSIHGKPFDKSYLDRELANYAKKAGVPRISLHSLRHTFATRCAEANVPLKVLQVILGHANIQTTMNIYVHVTSDEKQNGMTRFEQSLVIGDELAIEEKSDRNYPQIANVSKKEQLSG